MPMPAAYGWRAYGSAAKGGGASIDGEVIEARLIEWNDNFTTIANATFNNLVTIDVADYFYTEDLNQEMIYIPFNAPYTLENNKRYLFCLFTPATDVFLGYNTAIDHSRNETTFNQPMFPANDNGQWFAGGFGSDIVSANGVRMVSSVVGIDDQDRVEITPTPTRPTRSSASLWATLPARRPWRSSTPLVPRWQNVK
jgi:hypothetical protein